MRNLAPIVLFSYDRPLHIKQTVEALLKNESAADSELFIFSDGPKNAENFPEVREVRDYIRTINGFKSVTIIERDENYGLAKSIISGVTEVVNRFGRVIVLEDDLVTSPFFLRYMNDALTLYNDEELVVSIHGYVYPVKKAVPETFFIRGADCWGWGTWKRGWDVFEPDGCKLLNELEERGLTKEFDFNGAFPYTQMLRDQIDGRNNSWAVRWYASAFLRGKLTLYPGTSLVRNIGFDSSGTHCGSTDQFESCLMQSLIKLEQIEVAENPYVRESFISYFRSSCTPVRRVLKKLMAWIHSILP